MTKSHPQTAADLPPAGKLSLPVLASLPNPPKPRKVHDGGGLFLIANPNGSRYWRFSYALGGRRNTLSLGVYPAVTLDGARHHARLLRAQVAQGIDPSEVRQAAKAKAKEEAATRRAQASFLLSAAGALIVELPGRTFALTPLETRDLRSFLSETSKVGESDHGD